MRTPSSAYDQLRVSGFPPVRLGSWHRYRSLSQEFDHVFKPDSSSIAREPAVRRRTVSVNEAARGLAGDGVINPCLMQHFHVGIELKQILTPTIARARKTKIICAIGPASWSVEMLGERVWWLVQW